MSLDRETQVAEKRETAAADPIAVAPSGEWLEAADLQAKVLEACSTETDVTLDLEGADHLDTGSLQILLALSGAQARSGRSLHLVHASAALRRWFNYAGASSRLVLTDEGVTGDV